MALFNKLKDTKLKSLKFGQLQSLGDSTEPYIVEDINEVDSPLARARITTMDSGFMRGGYIGAREASITDTIRINKFLSDKPKGNNFIAKQIGLQKSNPSILNIPKLPTQIYNPENTLRQVLVNAFGQHIVRHGSSHIEDITKKYETVTRFNNFNTSNVFNEPKGNKLFDLYSKLFYKQFFGKKGSFSNLGETIISDNIGGPNSVYGVGNTTIRRTSFTGNGTIINSALTRSKIVLGTRTQEYVPQSAFLNYDNRRTARKNTLPVTTNLIYNNIMNKAIENQANIRTSIEFKTGPGKNGSTQINVIKFNRPIKNDSSDEMLTYSYTRDDDSLPHVIFTIIDPFNTTSTATKALSVPLRFKSFITGYQESYTSNWSDIKYNGRAEFNYVFNSYKKTASFKLQIPSFSVDDLNKNHNKLQSLKKALAGVYNNNRLGGVLINIKLGSYLDNYCIINSLNINIPDDSSWDWNIDENQNEQARSMLLEANFQITILDHETPGYVLSEPNNAEATPQTPTEVTSQAPIEVTPPQPNVEEINKKFWEMYATQYQS